MTLTVGGLCSGIGGLELGLEWAGCQTIWQSEIDPYCCRVLAKHWPDIPNLGDLTAVDWSTVERPDLVCAGFPCQPFSHAGRRRGANDPRHLWPHIAASLRLVRPEWVLLENVTGLLALGFGDVAADLAALGYDIEWECIPAAAVGAPHLRWRVFVVAHAEGPGAGLEGREPPGPRRRPAEGRGAGLRLRERGQPDVGAPAGGRGPDGSGWWDSEPDIRRVADGVPARMDRLRGLGNAVVPQVAEWVGRRILAAAARPLTVGSGSS